MAINKAVAAITAGILASGLAMAQEPRATHLAPPAQGRMNLRPPSNDRAALATPGMGKWWKNSELMQKIGVSNAQTEQIEAIFQDRRLKLVDLHSNLEKQESMLEPLVNADHPDQDQVSAQIDRIAAARAALEKSNAEMMLAIRRVLTVEQWKRLKAEGGEPPVPAPTTEKSSPRGPGD